MSAGTPNKKLEASQPAGACDLSSTSVVYRIHIDIRSTPENTEGRLSRSRQTAGRNLKYWSQPVDENPVSGSPT